MAGEILRPIDVEKIIADRDMLWAEAVARFDSGEKWHVDTAGLRQLCEEQQAERVADDAWLPIIASWLERPTRRGADGLPEPLDLARGVTTTDVLLGALSMKPGDMSKADAMRAADVLRQLGYVDGGRVQENGVRARRYRQPREVTS